MQDVHTLMESVLSDYIGSLPDNAYFPWNIARMAQGVGQGTQYVGAVSFESSWDESEAPHYMIAPGCVLYAAGPYSVDGLPAGFSFHKLISCREFYDRMESFWRQWYYPEHPEMREQLEPLMAQLKTSLGLDGPPEQDPPAPDPNVFYIMIDVPFVPIGQVPDDPDMADLLTFLTQAVRSGLGSPTGIAFWSDLRDDDPVTDPWVRWPAFVTMTAVCPGDEIPIEDRARLRAQHREFCGRVRAYLDGSYYGRNPGREEQTEAAMAALCSALGVRGS